MTASVDILYTKQKVLGEKDKTEIIIDQDPDKFFTVKLTK